jgi:Pyruvate/2-oxoacid:ferredoxin oxidoreductase gamma subunit
VCGAGFVARGTVFDKKLDELIVQALQHDGFALVDIWELCTAYYSPNNKFGKKDMFELLEFGGWATGILAKNDRPEYARAYHQQAAREEGKATDVGRPLQPRYTAALDRRLKVMIAGAAGGKVRSTGHLLGRSAVLSGLYATQRDDYPVTVMTGHSVCEVILDAAPIGYTGITRPDVLIWVAEEGRAKARPRLAAMTNEDRAYVAADLLDKGTSLDTQAQIIPLEYDRLAQDDRFNDPVPRTFRVRKQNRTILALGAVLRREGWYPFEALEATARETQREEIAALNLEALKASAGLLK